MPSKKTTKTQEPIPAPKVEQNKKAGKILFIAAIVILLLFVGYRNRSLFVVATVDGKPIWRPAFEQKIISQVGQKTLDDMINEQIILNEGAKRAIVITPEDVDVKIVAIQKTLPAGTTLDQALAGQGMTLADFKRQMVLQLTVEKMLASTPPITGDEIAKYLEQNRQFLTATDEAGLAEEAKQAIMNEKRNTEFQKLFQQLQKNAKVNKFL